MTRILTPDMIIDATAACEDGLAPFREAFPNGCTKEQFIWWLNTIRNWTGITDVCQEIAYLQHERAFYPTHLRSLFDRVLNESGFSRSVITDAYLAAMGISRDQGEVYLPWLSNESYWTLVEHAREAFCTLCAEIVWAYLDTLPQEDTE